MSQKINPEVCRQNKRLNLLLSETDAVYHEAAKRMGLADSDMKILYTLCHLGPQTPRMIEMENEAMANWTEQETDLYIELTQRYLQDFKAKIQTL